MRGWGDEAGWGLSGEAVAPGWGPHREKENCHVPLRRLEPGRMYFSILGRLTRWFWCMKGVGAAGAVVSQIGGWEPVFRIAWGGGHVNGADIQTHPMPCRWIARGGAGLGSLTSGHVPAGVGEPWSKREGPEGPPVLFKRSSSSSLGEPGRGVNECKWTKQGGVSLLSRERCLSVTCGNCDEVMRMNAERLLQSPEAGSVDVVVKWLLVPSACFWTWSTVFSQSKLL